MQVTTEAAVAGRQYLSFTLGAEEYGIEILSVQEIRGYTAVTPIPNTPAHIRGVINLRGAVVPVSDLRRKFGMEEAAPTKFTVIIVVGVAARTVGLVVDAVSDVLSLDGEALQPPPEMGGSCDLRYLGGLASLGERLVAVLDLERLLGEDLRGVEREEAPE